MLGGPAVLRSSTVIIRPDNFVQKRITPKDCVEQHFTIVDLTIIHVKVERPVRRQYAMRFDQARLQKCQIVVKNIAESPGSQNNAFVPLSLESDPISIIGAYRFELDVLLLLAGVEGRINVDQIDRLGRKSAQNIKIVR